MATLAGMEYFACRGLTRRPWFEGRSLELRAGEVVVLRGRSGSGKTLFLRTLADLDPADSGEVLLQGAPREGFSPEDWRSRVLYVHQRAPRLPGTVRDNLDRVSALAKQRGVAPISRPRGLEDDQDAARLSGGEAQILALGRALACDPDVLLLDESTSALDWDRAREWEERLLDWAKRGRAILWIAHDPSLVDRLGARVETLTR